MVKQKPSKLKMRVRFPSPAPYFWVKIAQVAQLVEHSLGKGEVAGSNPVLGTSGIKKEF